MTSRRAVPFTCASQLRILVSGGGGGCPTPHIEAKLGFASPPAVPSATPACKHVDCYVVLHAYVCFGPPRPSGAALDVARGAHCWGFHFVRGLAAEPARHRQIFWPVRRLIRGCNWPITMTSGESQIKYPLYFDPQLALLGGVDRGCIQGCRYCLD